MFLVFKQNGHIKFSESQLTNCSADCRASWHVAKFAKKYKFSNPVAGNFFQAEFDDYVPKLYEQLKLK